MYSHVPNHTWTALTRRLSMALALLALVLTSCSDRLPDGFGDICTNSDDCLNGLDCVFRYPDMPTVGTCLTPCTRDRDCPVVCRSLLNPYGDSYCRDDGYCTREECE